MDTRTILWIFILFLQSILTDDHFNLPRQKILLNSLFRQSSYPSIQFALQQINAIKSTDVDLAFDTNRSSIPVSDHCHLDRLEYLGFSSQCDVGTNVKIFFDVINRTTPWSVLMSDACQNVMSYIAEAATYFRLPVVGLSLHCIEIRYILFCCSFHLSIVIYLYHLSIVIHIFINLFLLIMRIISFENNYYNISIGHVLD